jgi:hypothetical protein
MGRQVPTGALVKAQADFFSSPGSVARATGIQASDLVLSLFYNNSLLAWPLSNGSGVSDSSISSGRVYFNEIPVASGFYSVRLFPDQVGYWRVVLVNVSLAQESSFEFDVSPATPIVSGLNASFQR